MFLIGFRNRAATHSDQLAAYQKPARGLVLMNGSPSERESS